MTTVALTINGKPASVDADGDTPLLWILAVSKRLLEKVISGSSNDAGSFRGLPMP